MSAFSMVLVIGLEPIRFVQPRDFKSLVSADSTTQAYNFVKFSDFFVNFLLVSFCQKF